ncbi:MAG: PQQ-binding-like beta-propeller repeat protein [Acidobacteriota bacterium]
MPTTSTRAAVPPLRLWPGVAAVSLQWLAWVGVPLAAPDYAVYGMFGGLGLAAVVLAWWLFASRAPWIDRLGALAVIGIAIFSTSFFVDRSISNGMMGLMHPIFSLPLATLGLVAGAALARHASPAGRRASIAAAIFVACAAMTLVRTGGIMGGGRSELHWRWTETAEERLLAAGPVAPRALPPPATPAPMTPAAPAVPAPASPTAEAAAPRAGIDEARVPETPSAPVAPAESAPEWPGFRGASRDSVVHGLRIDTDWTRTPPDELWRRSIGPGWSSFAVHGDLIYTQEQRGEDEIVSCYRLATGEPVWMHKDPVRFWESNGGPGPRATPTLHGDRVYTMGATGIVNVLDARTGARIWMRNAAADTGRAIPDWGFASSPLVVDDVVVVAVAGQLVGYDAATGEPRWTGPSGGAGYSSPHLAVIGGVPQVLLARGSRTLSVAPADGATLWEHSTGVASVSILQPALAPSGDVLVASGDGMGGGGVRRLAVSRAEDGWTVEERWNSRGLKPYFNDFVVHEGHAYGFDGSILAAIGLDDGERRWKGGRYGHGQLVLLPDQDVLLVLSEDGELALVSATPHKYTEVARRPALEGKTWNHPVLVGDVLLVRNGQEMAAFRLSRADPAAPDPAR